MKNKLITAYEYIGMAIMYATIYLPITIVLAISLSLSFISLALKMLSGIITTLSQIALWPANLPLAGYWKPLERHRKRTERWRNGVGVALVPDQKPNERCSCGSGRKFKNCCGAKC